MLYKYRCENDYCKKIWIDGKNHGKECWNCGCKYVEILKEIEERKPEPQKEPVMIEHKTKKQIKREERERRRNLIKEYGKQDR